LALKDKQMQIYLRQIELKAKSQEQQEEESKLQMQQLEKELEELHAHDVDDLNNKHQQELIQISRQMEGGSQDMLIENDNLKDEN
jgi:hypothetical protein